MSQPSPLLNESSDQAVGEGQPDRRPWQVGVRTLFLLIVAIALWMTAYLNHRRNLALEARIKTLMPMAPELVVDDPVKIAIVKLQNHWSDEHQWDVYLPEGRYRLCLATREIDDQGLAPVVSRIPIAAGRHRLELRQVRHNEVWRVALTLDGVGLPAVEEPRDWDQGVGSLDGSADTGSRQMAANEPAELFRRRFMRKLDPGRSNRSTVPAGPSEGILLWIEPAAASDAQP